ncbi:MAG: hypothetical protein ACLQDV_25690 [Candidatus Binataceae bacterium]
MKKIGSLTLAALTLITVWSVGPMCTGTKKAYAAERGSIYILTYYDVATAFQATVGGYGGPGSSGGTGDALLRIVNDGSGGILLTPDPTTLAPDAPLPGNVCANIYVYNDVQEQQECCSCPLTPNSLQTFSVIKNLTSNPFNPKESLSAGVIKIVGSVPADPAHCNNTVGAVTAATFGTNVSPGLHAWINHTETMASNQAGFTPPFGFVTSTSVTSLDSGLLTLGELTNELQGGCAAINEADVHASEAIGICQCGLGD